MRTLAAVVALMALTACGVTDRMGKRMDDTWAGDMLFGNQDKVLLTTDGGNRLNLDADGKPLSVVVRVYQLTSLDKFAAIDPDSLWDDPKKALGSTLVNARELLLLPGMGQVNQWPLEPAAQYVGVAAFFRSDEKGRWKVAFSAQSLRKDGIWFSSDGVRVLADQNRLFALHGRNVLNDPQLEKALAEFAEPAAQPADTTALQNIQDAATKKAADTATQSAQKTAESKLGSLVEGVQ
ncbi:type VI secretion system lipoprotein TssJ [Pseudomonas eucalypticola]|uniref:Type VI secretion system lipoprotein TssJ n=2 Tax=Pseudomonas eucalypticola TaxID=2599595 RepID=A0A7D5HKE6_9PSED|nr:type VI secretion system lipoprotein TssJ [Pseudomonas eucalypticola]QKZ07566.1 type VI secretion system lipoprotein TssJ [Pseudomonas eucalypticola]